MYRKEIDTFFEQHKDEYIRDLATLVAIDSRQGVASEEMPFGPGPAAVLNAALKIAGSYGLYTENWENYLGIVQLNNDPERKLDILAHLDVVPADESEWTMTMPFELKVVGDKVYGRGTADDKGPALAAIYALRAIKELGLKIRYNPRVFLGCNEENGAAELKYYFAKTEPAEMTISPDASFPVINVEKGIMVAQMEGSYEAEEPQILSIHGGTVYNTIAEKCTVMLKNVDFTAVEKYCEAAQGVTGVTFTAKAEKDETVVVQALGTAAHASLPETGNNAITATLQLLKVLPLTETPLVQTLHYLADRFPHKDYYGSAAGLFMEDEVSGKITVCADVLNYEAGKLCLTLDSRLPVCFSEEKMGGFLESVKQQGLSWSDQRVKPHYVDENSVFIQNLLESYEEFTGQKGTCVSMGGLTYSHGIENAVAFGFADDAVDNHMHGRDEFALLSNLMTGGKIYTQAILKLCNC